MARFTAMTTSAALLALTFLLPAVASAARMRPLPRAQRLAADHDLVQAMQQRDRGDLEGAVGAARALVEKRPWHFAAHRFYQELSAVGLRQGRLVLAEYEHLLAEDPSDPRRMVLRASAAFIGTLASPEGIQGEEARAIERALVAAETDKAAGPWARMVQADLLVQRSEPVDARRYVLAALDERPEDPAIRSEALKVYMAAGDTEAAGAMCLELIADSPWRAASCGAVLPEVEAAEQDRAVAALEKAEKRYTSDAVVLQALATLYQRLGERASRRRVETRLQELSADWSAPLAGPSPYVRLVKGGPLDADEERAFENLQALIESAGDDPRQLLEGLAVLETELPDSSRVKATLYRLQAHTLREPGVEDPSASRERILKALEQDPEDPQILNEAAYLHALDGVELERALGWVDRALELALAAPYDPLEVPLRGDMRLWTQERRDSSGAFLDTRGWLLFAMGRPEEALRDLQLAAYLTEDGTVQGHLGRVRHALGQDREALQHLLRALAVGTEDREEVHALAEEIYEASHVVSGGLDALVREVARQEGSTVELDRATRALQEHGPKVESRAGDTVERSAAPDFTVSTLDGEQITLSSLRGKVVVLDFWATWCGPCVAELPQIEELRQRYEGLPIEFLAMALDETEDSINGFLQGRKLGMRFVFDDGTVAPAYGVEVIPTLFIIDPQGRVVDHHRGALDDVAGTLGPVIEGLIR